MKYYDIVISLGQYCITSLCLRRVNLQEETMVFDWSAGRLEDVAGKGGIAGKVDLICNDFKNFYNKEDFENWGNNTDHDCGKFLIVNRRTGLQYKHDFPGDKSFEESFQENREKYLRRAERLYQRISESNSVLFVYMAYDLGFENSYLIAQYEKLQKKFPNKNIDMLFVMHDDKKDIYSFNEYNLSPNIKRIDLNFQYPSDPVFPENWNGNKDLYYPLLKNYCFTPVTIKHLNKSVENLEDINNKLTSSVNILKQQNDNLMQEMHNYLLKIEHLEQKPSSLEQIFSVKNEVNHKVIRIFGIKIKLRRKNNV